MSTSPFALIVVRNNPNDGVIAYRSPSHPYVGSSVTSTRSIDQPRSAAAIRPAVPGRPRHAVSLRKVPGDAGCAVHVSVTGTPRTPATAHSTCGHSAGGEEWTYRTPRAANSDLRPAPARG